MTDISADKGQRAGFARHQPPAAASYGAFEENDDSDATSYLAALGDGG